MEEQRLCACGVKPLAKSTRRIGPITHDHAEANWRGKTAIDRFTRLSQGTDFPCRSASIYIAFCHLPHNHVVPTLRRHAEHATKEQCVDPELSSSACRCMGVMGHLTADQTPA